jgi:hypothetical protein
MHVAHIRCSAQTFLRDKRVRTLTKSVACGAAGVRGAVWVPCVRPGLRHVDGLHHRDRRAVRVMFACRAHAAAALCVGCHACHGAQSARRGLSRYCAGLLHGPNFGPTCSVRGSMPRCTAPCAQQRRPPRGASLRRQALHRRHARALTELRSARRGADVVLAGRAAAAGGRVDHPQAAARQAHLLRG